MDNLLLKNSIRAVRYIKSFRRPSKSPPNTPCNERKGLGGISCTNEKIKYVLMLVYAEYLGRYKKELFSYAHAVKNINMECGGNDTGDAKIFSEIADKYLLAHTTELRDMAEMYGISQNPTEQELKRVAKENF